jgi:hypothetical protein
VEKKEKKMRLWMKVEVRGMDRGGEPTALMSQKEKDEEGFMRYVG